MSIRINYNIHYLIAKRLSQRDSLARSAEKLLYSQDSKQSWRARMGPMSKRRVASRSRSLKASSTKPQPVADRPFAPGYGILGVNEGNGLLPWAWVARKMKACRTFWLTTIYSGQGRSHVMPIWGVWLDDAFFFSTGRTSRKGQNLVVNPACTVTNDRGEEAVIVEGLATEVKDSASLERIATAYKKKYKMDPRSMAEPIFRVDPRRVFGFVEKTFNRSATRWKPGRNPVDKGDG
jgi:nitroimidazol reductase NimA-like FMN-containing flavoprotein (pyridoxamine 5'-phosphate oxidase superfamily)